MSKFSQFELNELRELQELLSNAIENDEYDTEQGASPVQEALLAEVYAEISERIGV